MKQLEESNLFSVLAQYVKLYHRPVPEEDLVRGLPLDLAKSGPDLFSCDHLVDNFGRAVERAGLTSRLSKKSLEDIEQLTLPVILIMKSGKGCILDRIDPEHDLFHIIMPESGDSVRKVSGDELRESYSGSLFFIGESFDHENRGKQTLREKSGHWFWGTLLFSKSIYWDVLKASFLVNLFVLASPIFVRNIYDRVVPNNAVETLWVMGIGIMVILVLDALLKFLRTYFVELAAKKSDIIITSRMFEKVLDFKMEEAPRNIGSFATHFKEFDTIRNFLTSSVTLAIVDLPFTVLFMWVTYFIGGKLVMVPALMMVLLLIYTMIIRKPLFRSIFDGFEASARKNSLLIEVLAGLRDIKFLNASGIFQWKWEKAVAEAARTGIKSRIYTASISTLTGFLIQMNSVLLVMYGVYLIRDQELTMGGLIAVSILSSRTIAPMGQVVSLISNYEQTKVAFDSVNDIMNKSSENDGRDSFVRKDKVLGRIEFKNVSFSYPDAERASVKDVSFKIEPGERVGLIGRTGSGKSTIHKLILGLYQPQEGSILLDGLSVSQISPVFLRKNVAHVPQDFTLIRGTLRENLTFKSPYAKDESLIDAVNTGGLGQFISGSPRGFDTMVEERGANLSGGQRQGVAIARAFVHPAPMVLLDEPTNSMDGTTEHLVREQLRKKISGKTTLLTTHKNSMLELVDRVLVMEGGELIFSGTPGEFVAAFSKTA